MTMAKVMSVNLIREKENWLRRQSQDAANRMEWIVIVTSNGRRPSQNLKKTNINMLIKNINNDNSHQKLDFDSIQFNVRPYDLCSTYEMCRHDFFNTPCIDEVDIIFIRIIMFIAVHFQRHFSPTRKNFSANLNGKTWFQYKL